MPEPHRRGTWWVLGLSVLLAAAFLLAPAMGTDLAAQQARAGFFAGHGWAPVDFGWYGGVTQFGYSLFTAALGSLIGMKLLGALSAVGAAVAFHGLLRAVRVPRPALGGLLGAVVFASNLVSGRITFAVGLALCLVALWAAVVGRRPWSWVAAAGLGGLGTWASPVAGLFAGLAGAAWLLSGAMPIRGAGRRISLNIGKNRDGAEGRWVEGLALCLGPAVALAPMALLFGNGGVQPFTAASMRIHVALAVLVVLVVPRRFPAVRIGAGLTGFLLVAAFLVDSPIGSNALRLPMLFTIPVVAALAELSGTRLALLLAAVFWWQPFVVTSDLGRVGSAESAASFYQPLVDQLAARRPGRVEVVPLRDHWEAAYVADAAPLARGWERQVDTDRNALFYADELTDDDYLAWLRDNAVSYVAVAPDSVPDRYARTEKAVVERVLTEVWHDDTWRLYAVAGAQPLVAPPGELVRSDRGGVTLRMAAAGETLVRVRWSRWLSAGDACLREGPDGWTLLRAGEPGEYRLTSSLKEQEC